MATLGQDDSGLVGQTRVYIQDPYDSGQAAYTDAQIIVELNDGYDELLALARQIREGWQEGISYVTGVAGTIDYSMPSNCRDLLDCYISQNGADLSSSDPATDEITKLTETTSSIAYAQWNSTDLQVGDQRWIFPSGNATFGILAPVTATEAGTNSIELHYTASSTALSSSGDSPIIPREWHKLLCFYAAMTLRGSLDLPNEFFENRWELGKRQFRADIKTRVNNAESSAAAAGRPSISSVRLTRAGSVKRL